MMRPSYSRWLRMLLLFVLVTTPQFAWSGKIKRSEPEKVYRAFARAFLLGDLDAASKVAAGEALTIIQRKRALIDSGEVVVTPPIKTEHMVYGERRFDGGRRVRLEGVLLEFAPKPDTDPIESAVLPHRQRVTLIKSEEGWR
ncbi:MAG: hypothetical protein HQL50_13360, partial [Magnetococcales bacterium]|nr:hypothetical protein [Magnetococcales bacterium]